MHLSESIDSCFRIYSLMYFAIHIFLSWYCMDTWTVDRNLRGTVYMACRSIQKCTKALQDIVDKTGAEEDNLVCMILDLASTKSIREFVADFKKREKKLDILINNAGVVASQGLTEDGFEITFGTNHLGHFLLTNLLMNELITAAPSRVVTVSSGAHVYQTGNISLDDPMLTKDWSMFGAYAQSKLANILFSKELGERLRGSGVTTYSLHPGTIQTDIGRDVFYHKIPGVPQILKLLSWPFMKSLWHGAQTQICCAVDVNLADETGKYYSDCIEKLPGVPAAFDDKLARNLWDLSVKLLNMSEQDLHPSITQ